MDDTISCFQTAIECNRETQGETTIATDDVIHCKYENRVNFHVTVT